VLRFFAGFGLSGETGAAITLISELIAPKKRGWGIALISGVGAMGPVVATVISMVIPWRITYVVAGVLGLLLFILRVRLSEPDIYRNMNVEKTTRGSLALLFQRNQRRIFLFCIILGLFSSYCWFLLNFFSAEFSGSVLAAGEVFNQKICLICFYFGTCIGTLFWNSLSQWLANRRKAVISVLVLGVVTCSYYLIVAPQTKVTASQLYMIYLLIGICGGCWALLNTIAAEHFGTNIRATATLLVANFLRAFSIPMILIFQILRNYMTLTNSAALIGMVLFMAGFVAISQLRETHGLDLDYVEALKTSPERS
jgi:MFS family permease